MAGAIKLLQSGGNNSLRRNTGSFPAFNAVTMGMWVRSDYNPGNDYWGPMWLGATGPSTDDYLMCYGRVGTTAQLKTTAEGYHETSLRTLTVDTWYYLALKHDGTRLTAYALQHGEEAWDGSNKVTVEYVGPSVAAAYLQIGNSPYNQPAYISVACFRLWNAALSDADIIIEACAEFAVNTTNLMEEHRFNTIETYADDNSGNSRTVTLLGDAGSSTVDGPTFEVAGGATCPSWFSSGRGGWF